MKKFFRIGFGGGLFFDMPNETEIPLNQFIATILMVGYVMNDSFCVPWPSITYIVVVQMEAGGQVVPFKPTVVS
jgi:hypothetical protein